MTYCYIQIRRDLSCVGSYCHRHVDGWREKDTRATMLFGRAFEQALSAYVRRKDPAPYCSESVLSPRTANWNT
jgi:hypothetical protein